MSLPGALRVNSSADDPSKSERDVIADDVRTLHAMGMSRS